MYNDYISRILSSLNRPYMEFWRVVERTGQTLNSGDKQQENIIQCLNSIVSLVAQHKIFLKYQTYRREDGQLLGFFDPQKIYRGVQIGNTVYYQNDTINVLTLTKIGSDTLIRPDLLKDRTMVTKQINQPIQRYELW